jgi:hypothetical protein
LNGHRNGPNLSAFMVRAKSVRIHSGTFTTKGHTVIKRLIPIIALFSMALTVSPAWADSYQDTINVFRKAVESNSYFKTAYGYAVFPTIGKGGIGIGGAFGNGRCTKEESTSATHP